MHVNDIKYNIIFRAWEQHTMVLIRRVRKDGWRRYDGRVEKKNRAFLLCTSFCIQRKYRKRDELKKKNTHTQHK